MNGQNGDSTNSQRKSGFIYELVKTLSQCYQFRQKETQGNETHQGSTQQNGDQKDQPFSIQRVRQEALSTAMVQEIDQQIAQS